MSALVKLPVFPTGTGSTNPQLSVLPASKRAELMETFRLYAKALNDPKPLASAENIVNAHLQSIEGSARKLYHSFIDLKGKLITDDIAVVGRNQGNRALTYQELADILIKSYKQRIKEIATNKAVSKTFL